MTSRSKSQMPAKSAVESVNRETWLSLDFCGRYGGQVEKSIDRSQKAGSDLYAL